MSGSEYRAAASRAQGRADVVQQNWVPYCGPAPQPSDWLAQWNFDPFLMLFMAGIAFWAVRRRDVGPRFALGYGLLALLFVSPLCALSSALFSVRVAHHILLTAMAAPLLVWALPMLRVRGGAAVWTMVHILLFWFWHAPQPYAMALSHDGLFWVMQLSLLGSAIGFWASLRGSSHVLGVGLLLLMMVQMGLLGALLTFASDGLYAPHYLSTAAWGLSPLEDQQVAGLLMWAPASAFYLGAALMRGWRMLDTEAVAA